MLLISHLMSRRGVIGGDVGVGGWVRSHQEVGDHNQKLVREPTASGELSAASAFSAMPGVAVAAGSDQTAEEGQ